MNPTIKIKFREIFMNNKAGIFLAILGFFYMNVLVAGVPIFWEGHLFHEKLLSKEIMEWVKIALNPYKEDFYDSWGGMTGVWTWILFIVWKYNFDAWRYTKSIFFAISLLCVYLLVKTLLKSEKYALFSTIAYLFSFPLYIHVLVFDGPFIVAEAAKLVGLLMFLYDWKRDKTNIVHQIIIFLCAWFAINTYTQSLSMIAVLCLSCIFLCAEKRKRYFILMLCLLTIHLGDIYDFGVVEETRPAMMSHTKMITTMFVESILKAVVQPVPVLENLYYKTFWEVVTVYGIVFIAASIFIVLWKKKSWEIEEKRIIYFSLFWFLSEIPLWFVLPDPALRYTSSLFPPSFLLLFFLLKNAEEQMRRLGREKIWNIIVLVLLLCIVGTNSIYSVAFRATWGSAFIAEGNAMEFIEQSRQPNSVILHYQPSTAPVFVPIDFSNTNAYRQKKDVIYLPISNFSDEVLLEYTTQYNEVYVVERVTLSGKRFPPTYDLDKSQILSVINVIYGVQNTIFDKLFFSGRIVQWIKPNEVIVYRVKHHNL